MSRIRRRQHKSTLSTIEKYSFMSVNSPLGWLGISEPHLSAFYSVHQHKMFPTTIVKTLCSQISCLRSLKYLRSTMKVPPRPDSGDYII